MCTSHRTRRDSRWISSLTAVILFVAGASLARAQEIGGEIGNEYELEILDHEACPVEILKSAYVRRPNLPTNFNSRFTEGQRMTTKFSVGVRNRSNRDIESVEVNWLAYGESSNKPILGRTQLLEKHKVLRPGKQVGRIDYGPAEPLPVHHYEVFVHRVTFADGTAWTRPRQNTVIVLPTTQKP